MWIPIAVGGHLCNAVAFIIDKFLITKRVPQPAVYAFFASVLSALTLLLLPFDPVVPHGWQEWLLDIGTGAAFTVALILFFTALKRGDASRILPFVGGLIPLITFGFASVWLGEKLYAREMIGFVLLVAASVVLAREQKEDVKIGGFPYMYGLGAAFFFALSSVLIKQVFTLQPFLSGFIWTRVGAFLAALFLLVSPQVRCALFHRERAPSRRTSVLFFIGQTMGAIGFLLIQYAFSLGSVTLVNAMQGLQYGFLFVLVFLIGHFYPGHLKESFSRALIVQKIIGFALVSVGLAFIM